jgi:hypothetical protein
MATASRSQGGAAAAAALRARRLARAVRAAGVGRAALVRARQRRAGGGMPPVPLSLAACTHKTALLHVCRFCGSSKVAYHLALLNAGASRPASPAQLCAFEPTLPISRAPGGSSAPRWSRARRAPGPRRSTRSTRPTWRRTRATPARWRSRPGGRPRRRPRGWPRSRVRPQSAPLSAALASQRGWLRP